MNIFEQYGIKEIADVCGIKKNIDLSCGETQLFIFVAENKRFTELEFITGNDLETSKVPLSV